MNLNIVWFLFKREMLDIFRDKKAVFMNIFIPIILYPLITILATQVYMSVNTSMDEKVYRFAVSKEVEDTEFYRFLEQEETLDKDETDENSKDVPVQTEKKVYFQLVDSDSPEEDLQNKEIDLYIEALEDSDDYNLHYVSSIVDSNAAFKKAETLMEQYREQDIERRIKELGADVEVVLHFMDVKAEDHSTKEQSMGSLLGGMIPFFLVMGLVGGAIHIAIDISVGEKERGTLETLFSLPVSSKEVLYGKFFAVATMAMISVFLNFISMTMMGVYFYKLMSSVGNNMIDGFDLGRFVPVMFVVLLCILLFALFITAVSLTIFFLSKSVKEAQNYAMPLAMLVSLISYIAFIPNVELNWSMALIPVANIVLLVKSAFQFQFDLPLMMGVLGSNLFYGVLTMSLMTNAFDKESMLFEEDIHFIRLFERRANLKRGGLPMVAEAIFLLIMGLVALIFVGSYAQLKFGFYGVVLTQLCIVSLPLSLAIYTKCDIKKTFALRLPKFRHLIGSVFLWIGTFLFVILLSVALQHLFPESYQNLEHINQLLEGRSFLSLMLVIALMPAICEEIFFRGYIFSAFNRKKRTALAILITSIFFGVFHMSVVRFFTTAILGVAMNYALYQSKSIVTSSLMHFLNNLTALSGTFLKEGVEEFSSSQMEQAATHLSGVQIIVFMGFIFLFVGIGMALLKLRKGVEEEDFS